MLFPCLKPSHFQSSARWVRPLHKGTVGPSSFQPAQLATPFPSPRAFLLSRLASILYTCQSAPTVPQAWIVLSFCSTCSFFRICPQPSPTPSGGSGHHPLSGPIVPSYRCHGLYHNRHIYLLMSLTLLIRLKVWGQGGVLSISVGSEPWAQGGLDW